MEKMKQNTTLFTMRRKKKEKINGMIKVAKITGDDCLLFADCDGKQMDKVIEEVQNLYSNISVNDIYCVCHEIESWYYAGVSLNNKKILKIKQREETTDRLTKEKFYEYLGINDPENQLETRLYIMLRMTELFEIKLACTYNNSFNSFFQKRQSLF